MDGLAAGLSALAFWGFLAAVVLGGIWYGIREREAQHETLRRIVDSGQSVNEEVVNRIFKDKGRPDRDLRVAGLIALFAAPGLAVLAWFIGRISAEGFHALLGVAGLVAFVSVGLLVASKVAENSRD